jgi:hypothetical protein
VTGGTNASGGSGGANDRDASAAFGQAIHWNGACATLEGALSSPLAFGNGEAFTVEVWFQIEPTTAKWQTLVHKGGTTVEAPGWQFFLGRNQDPPDLSTTFRLSSCVSDGTAAYDCDTLGELTPGRYHFALVRSPDAADASAAAMTLFYLPPNAGVHVSRTFIAATASWNTSLPFEISSCSEPLTGTMDELRIWKTARSERELFVNATTPLDCATEPDLLAYYDFEDLAQATLHECRRTFDVGIVPGALPESWAPTISPF